MTPRATKTDHALRITRMSPVYQSLLYCLFRSQGSRICVPWRTSHSSSTKPRETVKPPKPLRYRNGSTVSRHLSRVVKQFRLTSPSAHLAILWQRRGKTNMDAASGPPEDIFHHADAGLGPVRPISARSMRVMLPEIFKTGIAPHRDS